MTPAAATPPPAGGPARPENVPEKFWNAEKGSINVDALLEGHRNAESKLGAFTGAPKAGEDGVVKYEMPPTPEGIVGADFTEDDQLWATIQEWGAKHNCSQEGVNELVKGYVTFWAAENLRAKEDMQANLRERGLGDAEISEIDKFYRENLTSDEYDSLVAATGATSKPPDTVVLLGHLRRVFGQRTMAPATDPSQPQPGVATMETLEKIKADSEYYDHSARGEHLRSEALRVSKVIAGEV